MGQVTCPIGKPVKGAVKSQVAGTHRLGEELHLIYIKPAIRPQAAGGKPFVPYSLAVFDVPEHLLNDLFRVDKIPATGTDQNMYWQLHGIPHGLQQAHGGGDPSHGQFGA